MLGPYFLVCVCVCACVRGKKAFNFKAATIGCSKKLSSKSETKQKTSLNPFSKQLQPQSERRSENM